MTENEISNIVLGVCIKVHTQLGPGLLESVYEECLCYELKKAQIPFTRQMGIPINYDSVNLPLGFRADLVIENKVIIEIKSVENLIDIHKSQLLTYLRLSGIKLGLLINFNTYSLKDGIKRVANGL